MTISSSRSKLEQYAATGKYLFHGSEHAGITELEPRITTGKPERAPGVIYIEDTPVISATDNIDVAIFAASVWRRGYGSSGWHTSIDRDGQQVVRFTASAAVIEEVLKPDSVGYVYVLPRSPFKRSKEMPTEFRTSKTVKPVAAVQVHATDLRPKVQTLKSNPQKAKS